MTSDVPGFTNQQLMDLFWHVTRSDPFDGGRSRLRDHRREVAGCMLRSQFRMVEQRGNIYDLHVYQLAGDRWIINWTGYPTGLVREDSVFIFGSSKPWCSMIEPTLVGDLESFKNDGVRLLLFAGHWEVDVPHVKRYA